MKEIDALWQEVLSSVEIDINALSFDVWIKPLQPIKIEDDILVLSAPTPEFADNVMSRFLPLLKRTLRRIENAPVELVILSEEEVPQKLAEQKPDPETYEPQPAPAMLDPKYNFEDFVVGKCNLQAFKVAQDIAANPGDQYNPMFIYGAVGLGKTHLMQAIGNDIRMTLPNMKMVYVSMDTFINEYIDSIRSSRGNNNKSFREKYRNVDLLMIDDVQFLAGHPGTQDELFHTFEALKSAGKQMIFASDRSPKDIPDLADRIRSRFSSNIVVDVQPPDLETRIAIIQKKAQKAKTNIDIKNATYIAERVTDNIREIEGVLSKVCYLAKLYSRKVDADICREALKDYKVSECDELTVDEIVECTCKYFGVAKEDIIGKKKNKEFVVPRMYAIYVVSELMTMPLAVIGEYFGGREHTTVIHSRDKIAALVQSDAKAKTIVNDIKAMALRR